jgi:poly-beta-hydroxyalkanoate depolymerase
MANSLITEEMEDILKYVEEHAGEVDFSFHLIATSSPSKPIHEAATLLSVENDSGKVKNE